MLVYNSYGIWDFVTPHTPFKGPSILQHLSPLAIINASLSLKSTDGGFGCAQTTGMGLMLRASSTKSHLHALSCILTDRGVPAGMRQRIEQDAWSVDAHKNYKGLTYSLH